MKLGENEKGIFILLFIIVIIFLNEHHSNQNLHSWELFCSATLLLSNHAVLI